MDLRELSLEHEEIISSYYRKRTDNFNEMLSNIYNFVKSITDIYYINNRLEKDYFKSILLAVDNAEYKFKYLNSRIIKNEVYFKDCSKSDNFLDFLVYRVRNYIFDKFNCLGVEYPIEDINLSNYCVEASVYVEKLCDKNNVKCYTLKIHPGYNQFAYLYNGAGYHYANIIEYNGKHYLLDSTISQFFYTRTNNLDRLGIVEMSGCDMGIFLLMSEIGKKIASTLLKYGYIELTEVILKTYLDAFTVSFRNGLYYESTNDFSYSTDYTIDDYIKFLNGEDNQVNYEGKENLGYQGRPLKKWDMDFTRR